MSTSTDQLVTIKTSEKARKWLRIVSAHTGEHQYQVMERLLSKEILKLENGKSQS